MLLVTHWPTYAINRTFQPRLSLSLRLRLSTAVIPTCIAIVVLAVASFCLASIDANRQVAMYATRIDVNILIARYTLDLVRVSALRYWSSEWIAFTRSR